MNFSETDADKSRPSDFVVGVWTVAPSLNLLVHGDEQVRVEPRVMDVLVHLAGRTDQLVSKEDLTEQVWKSRYVTDDVLTVTIYALRKALRDDARKPRYIETVSRRGYRLIAPLQPVAPASARSHTQARPEVACQAEASVRAREGWWRRPRYPWPAIAATVALARLAAGAMSMLTVARHSRHVPSAEAHEAYVKGRYFLDQRRRGCQPSYQSRMRSRGFAVSSRHGEITRACRGPAGIGPAAWTARVTDA